MNSNQIDNTFPFDGFGEAVTLTGLVRECLRGSEPPFVCFEDAHNAVSTRFDENESADCDCERSFL